MKKQWLFSHHKKQPLLVGKDLPTINVGKSLFTDIVFFIKKGACTIKLHLH